MRKNIIFIISLISLFILPTTNVNAAAPNIGGRIYGNNRAALLNGVAVDVFTDCDKQTQHLVSCKSGTSGCSSTDPNFGDGTWGAYVPDNCRYAVRLPGNSMLDETVNPPKAKPRTSPAGYWPPGKTTTTILNNGTSVGPGEIAYEGMLTGAGNGDCAQTAPYCSFDFVPMDLPLFRNVATTTSKITGIAIREPVNINVSASTTTPGGLGKATLFWAKSDRSHVDAADCIGGTVPAAPNDQYCAFASNIFFPGNPVTGNPASWIKTGSLPQQSVSFNKAGIYYIISNIDTRSSEETGNARTWCSTSPFCNKTPGTSSCPARQSCIDCNGGENPPYSCGDNSFATVTVVGPTVTLTPSISQTPGACLQTGDLNKDGILDQKDFSDWLNEFYGGGTVTDCNIDGKVDLKDFNIWRNKILHI